MERPFAAFTLDDGYRDNMHHAWPVFRRHGCPFTIFVAPAYADGESELWWEVLEEVIRHRKEIRPGLPDLPRRLRTDTPTARRAAWQRLYPVVRYMEEHAQREWIRDFGQRHGVDPHEQCRRLIMNWNELREMVADPLCSIGAHTLHHRALARIDAEEARYEMAASRARLEEELEREVRTLAYPYGDADSAGAREFALARALGFKVALTTRKGHLYPEHAEHLTALPRLSLNGFYQNTRYLDVLLSGLPFLLYNRFRRLDVA
jgi:peptidoglycan/xylan/chitin deacetylase (PgdA/CDA1 family)